MTINPKITDWHRSFWVAMEGDFADYSFEVLREEDMSIQEEYLDVLIINTREGTYPAPLPDGLENLKSYNLITYKSLHESLNVWTIEKLIGHYVSYRKILSGKNKKKEEWKKLPPEEGFQLFQLYAICTMYPRKLLKQHKHRKIKKGVYDVTWGERQIRVIVLRACLKIVPEVVARILGCADCGCVPLLSVFPPIRATTHLARAYLEIVSK